jgi:hypothetical protein
VTLALSVANQLAEPSQLFPKSQPQPLRLLVFETINPTNFAMTECKQEVFEFQVHGSRKVTGDFSGGYLSSDGGAVFLRGVDLKMGLIEKITFAIRKRFGRRVRIIVRADSGFAREEIMAWCEANAVYYCLGLARNKRLGARLGKSFGELYRGIKTGEIQVPCRRFEDFEYRTRKSWSRARRVVGKAEILDKGQNPRFVVTNLPAEGFVGEPEERFAAPALYEKLYCARGEMENRIKEAQQDLFADRTSTGWMASNQLRVWFSAFAHLMLSVLRAEVVRGTDLAKATLGQIRLKLFKIGARIKISCRRIHLELASAYPLPGNLPARLYKPLRNAGELNFKEALVDTRKRTGFQPTQDPVPNFPHQGQKDPRSPLCDSDQAG